MCHIFLIFSLFSSFLSLFVCFIFFCTNALLQSYLSDEDFEKVFHMKRDEFEKIPQWKRENLKRDVYLY